MSGEEGSSSTSPHFLFSKVVYKWLESALDYGFTEFEFWEYTIAELERAIDSKKRVKLATDKERASFDYTLADLIGRSISRIYSSSNTMPELCEVYPILFDSKEIEEYKAEKRAELSAARFKQFATSFNKNFKKEEAKDN